MRLPGKTTMAAHHHHEKKAAAFLLSLTLEIENDRPYPWY
jgi:hypothetical protein